MIVETLNTIHIIDNIIFSFLDNFNFTSIYFPSFLSYYFFYLFFFLFLIYLYFIEREIKIINLLLLLSILGFCLIYSIKYIVKRYRPKGLVEKLDYSFPSSHTFFASLIIIVSYFFIRNYFSKILFIVFSLFSIFSILILKIHYFSDILFSIILGFSLFYISFFRSRYLENFFLRILEKLVGLKKKILRRY